MVSGHILKQLGINRFLVSDGTVKKIVKLATTTNLATSLTGSLATIEATTQNGTEHVKSLHAQRCVTTEGHSLSWKEGVVSTGKCQLSTKPDLVFPIFLSFNSNTYTDGNSNPILLDDVFLDPITIDGDGWSVRQSSTSTRFSPNIRDLFLTNGFSVVMGHWSISDVSRVAIEIKSDSDRQNRSAEHIFTENENALFGVTNRSKKESYYAARNGGNTTTAANITQSRIAISNNGLEVLSINTQEIIDPRITVEIANNSSTDAVTIYYMRIDGPTTDTQLRNLSD